jgi:hypothetical protein
MWLTIWFFRHLTVQMQARVLYVLMLLAVVWGHAWGQKEPVCQPHPPALQWAAHPPRPPEDHIRRDARRWCSRPADLLHRLPLQPLDRDDQRRQVAGQRPAVRNRTAIHMPSLRQARRRCPPELHWEQEARRASGVGSGVSTIRFPLPRVRQFVALQDAGRRYITELPQADHDADEWQSAMKALLLVAEHDGRRCSPALP